MLPPPAAETRSTTLVASKLETMMAGASPEGDVTRVRTVGVTLWGVLPRPWLIVMVSTVPGVPAEAAWARTTDVRDPIFVAVTVAAMVFTSRGLVNPCPWVRVKNSLPQPTLVL